MATDRRQQNSQRWPQRPTIRRRYDEAARRSGHSDLEAVLADPDLTFAGVGEVLGVSAQIVGVMRRQRGLGQIGHTRSRDRADKRRAAAKARRDAAERGRHLPAPIAAQLRRLYGEGDDGALREALAKARVDGYTLAAIGEALGVSREAVRLRITGKIGQPDERRQPQRGRARHWARSTSVEEGGVAERVVYRHEIPVDGQWHALEQTGDILHVASRQPELVEVWAVHGDRPPVTCEYRVFGTGQPLPADACVWVGTTLAAAGGRLVWHLWQRGEADRG